MIKIILIIITLIFALILKSYFFLKLFSQFIIKDFIRIFIIVIHTFSIILLKHEVINFHFAKFRVKSREILKIFTMIQVFI